MPESFGARLRRRREEQDIALHTIAEQTKIKLSLLEALERDDVSHWPSGIFRRAFIRAYALAIGLDPDVVVREFVDLYPEPVEDLAMVAATAALEGAGGKASGPPTRLRYIVGSAIESLARLRRTAADAPAVAVRQASTPSPVDAGLTPTSVPSRIHEEMTVDAGIDVPQVRAPAPDARPGEHGARQADRAADGQFDDAAGEAAEPSVPQSRNAGDELPSADTVKTPHWNMPAEDVAGIREAEPAGPDFTRLAQLCSEFARIQPTDELEPLLKESARILDALGLIVWVWDDVAEELAPVLVHGYSDKVLAQLPPVKRDADNATAAAFRAGRTCVIGGSEHMSGALVVPLPTPDGCAGVLALELQRGAEHHIGVQAAATIIAAMLAQLGARRQKAEVSRPGQPPMPASVPTVRPSARTMRR